jgi:prolyl oligopeptidase
MLHAHLPLAPVAAAAAVFGMLMPAFAQQLNYPQTRKTDQVDDYHGVKVADPYRWLEDDNSAETAAWVEAQNKVTFGYLDKIPFRAQVRSG